MLAILKPDFCHSSVTTLRSLIQPFIKLGIYVEILFWLYFDHSLNPILFCLTFVKPRIDSTQLHISGDLNIC